MQKGELGEWIGDRPHDLLANLRRQMNRLFDEYAGGRLGGEGFAELPFAPEVDIHEEKDKVIVTAELPGIEEQNVQISVGQGVIDIRGEKYEERRRGRRARRVQECHYGSFQRTLPLPPDTDTENANADFSNGVLTVTFPRKPGALEEGRKIPITESGFAPPSEEALAKKDTGEPGGGAGRVEVVKGSGVYPPGASDTPRTAAQKAEHAFGQGERGAAGYEDSGGSGILPPPESPKE